MAILGIKRLLIYLIWAEMPQKVNSLLVNLMTERPIVDTS
jgi:hypothetical protein